MYRADIFPDSRTPEILCIVTVQIKCTGSTKNGWHYWETLLPHPGYTFKTLGKGHYEPKSKTFLAIDADPREAILKALEKRLLHYMLNAYDPKLDTLGEVRRLCNLFIKEVYPISDSRYLSRMDKYPA